MVGRDHRSVSCTARIADLLARMRKILSIPDDRTMVLTPGSTSGAFAAALWGLLGERPVTVAAWDKFGHLWADDVIQSLAVPGSRRVAGGAIGVLPPLSDLDGDNDLVFVWNATTVGAAVPDADWIGEDKDRLVLCDAAAAAFVIPLDWRKLDAVAFSWQKALGGESQHGVLVLSPRARARWRRLEDRARPKSQSQSDSRLSPEPWQLAPKSDSESQSESQSDSHPNPCLDDGVGMKKSMDGDRRSFHHSFRRAIPRILRLALDDPKTGRAGEPIIPPANTMSMLAIEDADLCLDWVEEQGGLAAMEQRSRNNYRIMDAWVGRTDWVDFLVPIDSHRPLTPVCLRVAGDSRCLASMGRILGEERAAYDIASHPWAGPGLRIWTGPTVEGDDLACLTEWLDWAHARATAPDCGRIS